MTIALDIDGTLTTSFETIPDNVKVLLKELSSQGWDLLFVTGRTFQWSERTLRSLQVPCYFSVQNGATTLEVPSGKVVDREYIPADMLPKVWEIVKGTGTDAVIYSGYEGNDTCYYVREHFSDDLWEYVTQRKKTLKENWVPLQSESDRPFSSVGSVKCFGSKDSLIPIAKRFEEELNLHSPVIKDPFRQGYYVAQATHEEANKGTACIKLIQKGTLKRPCIAAGDDLNDFPLLQAADVAIAMKNAPQQLLDIADIVAECASQEGIVEALKRAVEWKKISAS